MKWKSRAHPISDVRDWDNERKLELRPDFQRNEVWSRAAQVMLIDTILKDIPIPKVYIQSMMRSEKTYRVVIDGQQRLTAILAFINNKYKLNKPYIGQYSNMNFSALPEDVRNMILQYNIDINEIYDPTDEEVRDLYARVNKYTVQLNKQELRKADFVGHFINLAEKLSDIDFFKDAKTFSAAQIRRMLDVEYIEELLCVLLVGEQNKKETLDAFCEKYEIFEEGFDIVENRFLEIIRDITTIFDENLRIETTRFKQKSDFYSLFGVIVDAKRRDLILSSDNLATLREKLVELDSNIEPNAEDDDMRRYAIFCTSDANSLNSRIWRKEYLSKYILTCYK